MSFSEAQHPTRIKLSMRSLRSRPITDEIEQEFDYNAINNQVGNVENSDGSADENVDNNNVDIPNGNVVKNNQSGSEYDEDANGEEVVSDVASESQSPQPTRPGKRGRRPKSTYVEDPQEGTDYDSDEIYDTGRRGRKHATQKQIQGLIDDDDYSENGDDDTYSLRGGRNRRRERPLGTRRSGRVSKPTIQYYPSQEESQLRREKLANERAMRAERRNRIMYYDDDDDDDDDDESPERRAYSLRTRREKPNYIIPPPIDNIRDVPDDIGRLPSFTAMQHPGIDVIPWNSKNNFGLGDQDSDNDDDISPQKRPTQPAISSLGGGAGGLMAPSGGIGIDGLATGGPSNLGKIGDSAFADTDPLGVNTNVSFDSVGGLDEHIRQLKEMVSLPLLYPEVFQRFNLTPPRGVLFHGPPGTGKTLIARALAASCSSENQKISFFMRKGADCLSKWVGEAERQLRLLFEEAKAVQPSIIFFDEIDGLAPVRSSKQEQIHASIVSTLLALMDGMDGRGQVVVIGATNRPDAVDPALRRPGRFDREFYFPLPNEKARAKIIEINTKGWNPPLDKSFIEKLASLTKGYGGADIKALCTEAALNAVQRRYPQIYKTNQRLLLDPKSIDVHAKDFMRTVNKLIPSSARSSLSNASPIPKHLLPILINSLENAKEVISKILPRDEEKSIIEEAEYVDELGEDGGFSLEIMKQNMNSMRTYRPRIIIHGDEGLGQTFIGSALLHFLEGYNIQNLDIANLLSDSTRTIESACVQLILEAKRNKPSIIYIPSLDKWCNVVTESARTTVITLLNTITPSDPILLLVTCDENYSNLPVDVKKWFGSIKDNKLLLKKPNENELHDYFKEVVDLVKKQPNEFPDTYKKKKRVLEDLPVAPPPAPRQLTESEIQLQRENDARIREHLKWRLGAILDQLKKKFKKFMRSFADEIAMVIPIPPQPQLNDLNKNESNIQGDSQNKTVEDETQNMEDANLEQIDQDQNQNQDQRQVSNDNYNHESQEQVNENEEQNNNNNNNNNNNPEQMEGVNENNDDQQKHQHTTSGDNNNGNSQPENNLEIQKLQIYDIDLEKIHYNVYYDKYLNANQFVEDIIKIVHNAELDQKDQERLWKAQQMLTHTKLLVDQAFDPQFRLECERMTERELKRISENKAKRKAEKEKEKNKEVENESNTNINENENNHLKRHFNEIDDDHNDEIDNHYIDTDDNNHNNHNDVDNRKTKSVKLSNHSSSFEPSSQVQVEDNVTDNEDENNEFVCENGWLQDLLQYLVKSSLDLNVDELEQVRSRLFSIIWNKRYDWNRVSMINEMKKVMKISVEDIMNGDV